jgi:hypothetical protein
MNALQSALRSCQITCKKQTQGCKIEDAVDAYHQEQSKPTVSQKGAWLIAKEFGIEGQWKTIINQASGGQSVQEAHVPHQKLTLGEEATLASFLEESATCGFPQTLQNINQLTNLI